MKDNISKRDWETISAYLDEQLSPRKKLRFEARLGKYPHLQNALDEMRTTRRILQNTPRMGAPRNFMLTPEMAGQPHRMPRLAPVFGWASAVASFLLILVLVGDVFSAGGFIPTANNVLQQDEFIAPRGQSDGDETLQQPSVAGKMEAPLKGSAAETAPTEFSEQEGSQEVAADSAVEATPTVEPITTSKEIEVFTAAESAISEQPEERAGPDAAGEAVFEAPLEAAPSGGTQEEVDDTNGEIEPVQSSANLEESALVSNTVDTDSASVQPTDISLDEGKSITPEDLDGQESQPEEPQTNQVGQPASEAVETLPAVESITSVTTDENLVDVPAPPKDNDFVLGTEVILGLFALGAGLAWIYLRRRGS